LTIQGELGEGSSFGENQRKVFFKMPRFTAAYSSFCIRIPEVNILHSRASRLETIDPIRNSHEIDALCRGSIVLLSSHLEAYIKELGELFIRQIFDKQVNRNNICASFFYHISKDYLDRMKDSSDPVKIAAAIFEFIASDVDYWSRSGPLPIEIDADRFNSGFSNPSFKKIKKYFNRFGFYDYEQHIARSLRSNFQPYVNMVNHLVEVRNAIAHGDTLVKKTPKEISDITQMIQAFSRCTDVAFGNWSRDTFCVIR